MFKKLCEDDGFTWKAGSKSCSSRSAQLTGKGCLAGLPFDEFHTQPAMFRSLFAFVARQPQQDLNRRGSPYGQIIKPLGSNI